MVQRTQEYWETRPEIHQMTFDEFSREYNELLPIMKAKEGDIGKLDLHRPNYVPMTDDEKALHEKDWRVFSRGRGFSEYDIAEYGRWHKITGQTDGLEHAFNDPWRRNLQDWDVSLYLKHIELARKNEVELRPEVEQSYISTKNKQDEAGKRPYFASRFGKHRSDTSTDAASDSDDNWISLNDGDAATFPPQETAAVNSLQLKEVLSKKDR